MDVSTAIESRRAYRSLEKADVTDEIIKSLALSASLSPSCFNNQPWRFVFVYEEATLGKLKTALPKGNDWARNASMMIAVLSKQSDDCVLDSRKYYLLDTGMAVAFLILKATELGYVAHPIAGYNPETVKQAISSPDDMEIITILVFGKHKKEPNPSLNEKQMQDEAERPKRKSFSEYAYLNKFNSR